MSKPEAVTPVAPASPRRAWARVLWPVIGVAAVGFSLWLLIRELRAVSLDEVEQSLAAITWQRWLMAVAATGVAYAALAWYDRIALAHLGFKLPWPFIAAVSFTTYALSHNIGMTMFSGAVVRYRAYSTRGLSLTDVGVLVGFCSFTFALGTILLSSVVFLSQTDAMAVLLHLPPAGVRTAGLVMLAFVALYLLGSALHFRPMRLGSFRLVYPNPGIALRQLMAGPLELVGAAGIIYSALPAADNPGFIVILGVFLASFSAALLSHAPGGLGVLELVFVTALPDMNKPDVLAALLVFRLLYLLVPLGFGIIAVLVFERGRLGRHALE